MMVMGGAFQKQALLIFFSEWLHDIWGFSFNTICYLGCWDQLFLLQDLHCWYPWPQPSSAFWIRKLNVKQINIKTCGKGQVAFLMCLRHGSPCDSQFTTHRVVSFVIRVSAHLLTPTHPCYILLFHAKHSASHAAQLATRYLCSHTDYATSVFLLWGVYLLAVRSHLVRVYCT